MKLLTLIFASLMTSLAHAQAGDIAAGEKAYKKNMCDTCHGTAGQGGDRGAGPTIAPNPFPFEAFAQQVRRPRAVMPRYPEEFLSAKDMTDIYAYMLSIKPGPKAKDIPLLKKIGNG